MPQKQSAPQFKLRLPPELRDMIEVSAKKRGRTMNDEIVDRLSRSFGATNYLNRTGTGSVDVQGKTIPVEAFLEMMINSLEATISEPPQTRDEQLPGDSR